MYKQASWSEPLLFQMDSKGRRGHVLSQFEEAKSKSSEKTTHIPVNMLRNELGLPSLSEVQVVRHFTRLAEMNYGVDSGLYPLGSCTMKYNPKINENLARLPEVAMLHPYQNSSTTQGMLEILYKLERWLAEITGTFEVCLHPAAGAHGEFLGTLLMRQCLRAKGECEKKTEVIVPDSAHGTNPASAAMAGFNVVVLPSGKDGCINVETLKAVVSSKTAGLMLTNPNTLGLFEKDICEIAKIIHGVNGILYYDGANLNPLLCKVRPGDMGFDIVHINIHKTFSTPHGGGGPGAGPVGVCQDLAEFLPVPRITFDGKRYTLNYDKPKSLGKIGGFYGNIGVLVRAFAYILSMGRVGLEEAAEVAVLNANYLMHELSEIRGLTVPYDGKRPRKHEFVVSASRLKKETGVSVVNLAKRLLDYGVHAPTVYFPLIVEEAMMIEPTETFEKEELDRFISIMKQVCQEAYTNPQAVLSAPSNTAVTKLDEVKASHPRTIALSWRMQERRSTQNSQEQS